MNYAESFEEFSSSLQPVDLALYAGIGIVLWVLFKDKMSPVQKFLLDAVNNVKGLLGKVKLPSSSLSTQSTDDVFINLVKSWKETRDWAVKANCEEAVKTIDKLFPYLSPELCKDNPTGEVK